MPATITTTAKPTTRTRKRSKKKTGVYPILPLPNRYWSLFSCPLVRIQDNKGTNPECASRNIKSDNANSFLQYMKRSRSMSGLDWPNRRKGGRNEDQHTWAKQNKRYIQHDTTTVIICGSFICKRVWWQTPKTRMFKLNGCNSIRQGNWRRVATPLLATETTASIERERESNEQQETTWGKPIFKSKSLAIADHQIEQKHAKACTCQDNIHRISCRRRTHAPSLVFSNVSECLC